MSIGGDLNIRNARLHGIDQLSDLVIRGGRIQALVPAQAAPDGVAEVDAAGGLVSRSFVEPHFHPGTAFSRELDAGTVEDVAGRATRALRLAAMHGVTALRVTAEVDASVGLRVVEGVVEACRRTCDLVDTEVVACAGAGLLRDAGVAELVGRAVKLGARYVGGRPNMETSWETQVAHARLVFDLAAGHGVGVDMHADCRTSPDEEMLEVIARETIARSLQSQVLVSHCSGLEVYDDERAARVIATVAEADLRVVVIPPNIANEGGRGHSRPRQLAEAGVTVAAGSGRLCDDSYPLGTLDPLDRAYLTYLGAGYDAEPDLDTVWDMVTTNAAVAIGRSAGELVVGADADLVVLSAADRATALARLPGSVMTVRRGRVTVRKEVSLSFSPQPLSVR